MLCWRINLRLKMHRDIRNALKKDLGRLKSKIIIKCTKV